MVAKAIPACHKDKDLLPLLGASHVKAVKCVISGDF